MINFFDLVVVVNTIGLAVYGFFEGLLRGAVKLIGIIVTIVLLAVFSNNIVGMALTVRGISPRISIPLAFLFAFIIGSAIFYIGATLLHKIVHKTPVGFVDSGLGSAFGVIKALILNGTLATIISFTPPGTFLNSQFEKSLTAKPLMNFLSEIIPLVKKAGIPIYQRLVPVPREQENNHDNESISPDII